MQRQDILSKISTHQSQLQEMGVSSLSLFGSVARDEASESSDGDMLVEFNRRIGLFQFIRVKLYLEEILNVKKVDLVMPDALFEEFKDDILKEAIHTI